MTVADLKALIESETRFPDSSQHLYHNGRLLADHKTALHDLGVVDGEMLAMHVRGTGAPEFQPAPVAPSSLSSPPNAVAMTSGMTGGRQRVGEGRAAGTGAGTVAGRGTGGTPDPEMLRLQILGDPRARAHVQQQNPDLASALENPDRFRQLFMAMQRQQADSERQRQREIAMLNDDPFNVEAQAKIEELIRQEAVMENLQNALEHNPEGEVQLNLNRTRRAITR